MVKIEIKYMVKKIKKQKKRKIDQRKLGNDQEYNN